MLARAYLADEAGHDRAVALLADPSVALVTGSWTRVEVSGALVRAARRGRADEKGLLALLDSDLAGPVVVLTAAQEHVERHALDLVRRHALRAMDAWHLAVAAIAIPRCSTPGSRRRSPPATPHNWASRRRWDSRRSDLSSGRCPTAPSRAQPGRRTPRPGCRRRGPG
ncbi:MAG: type II toxin-antitoxin system VapC family toxin [Mycobacterium sp.]